MKIALLGYGKMGKTIEKLAVEKGHQIILTIDSSNANELNQNALSKADVAIEFSKPDLAVKHILLCFESKVPVVVGTTGWYESYEKVKKNCREKGGSILAATNFSVGVNLFFELNRNLARIMNQHHAYKADITEIHHTQKLDSPSGTAISLAEDLINEHDAYQDWVNNEQADERKLSIKSIREEDVKGTHTITYESGVDRISIEHFAKNRDGFALGAIIGAEYIKNKTGIFSMKDVLKL